MNHPSAYHHPAQQSQSLNIPLALQKPHAIDRSNELLSVARTALLIAQQEQRQRHSSSDTTNNNTSSSSHSIQTWDILSIQPTDLTLHQETSANTHGSHNGLNGCSNSSSNTAQELLSEAMLTLSHLDETLKKLSNLVKRRGHTNDPTNDINVAMCDFQSFVKDIMEIIETTLPQAAALPPLTSYDTNSMDVRTIISSSSSGQRRKHYEMAAKTLKSRVEVRMEKFKTVMKVRGDVIKDLTERRKRLLNNSNETKKNHQIASLHNAMNGGTASIRNRGVVVPTSSSMIRKPPMSTGFVQKNKPMTPSKVKSQLNSPLFTMSQSNSSKNPYGQKPSDSNNNTSAYNPYARKLAPTTANNNTSGATSSAYGYGNTGYGNNGYGGYNNNSSNTTGMRHRGGGTTNNKDNNNSNSNNSTYNPYQMEDENKVHDQNPESIQTQIQKRRAARQTKNRLESARMAEKSLTELTSMFGKMSTLIQSQGETLEKIEDDVEVAMGYVDDGHEEVGKLYEYTKGNRGIIIKSFSILIFFIIFMRFYG